ncbi:MAG TPA: glycosyltransferase family 39 protein, partial [Chloroflexota bacterium]|nr:glycosyltransferase family 39 protein [Chloroflexota bacterium]
MQTRTRDRLLFAAWVAWTLFVLSHYYVQLWRAVAARALPSPAIPAFVALLLVAATSVGIRSLARKSIAFPPRLTHVSTAFLLGAFLITVPWAAAHDVLLAAGARLTLPGFPWFGEAVARSGTALVGATLVATAACSSGSLVLRSLGLRATSVVEYVVFAAVTGIGVVSYTSLLLALAGVYRPMPVAGLVAVLILAGMVRRRGAPAVRYVRAAAPIGTAAAVWSALAAVALGYALAAALAPEKEYDALWYHLQLPRLWLEAGHPVDVVHEYVSLYPLTWELVFGAGMVLGGPVGAKLLHFACLPALAALVVLAARRFLPGVSSAAAVAILVVTPTLLWESTTTYVDLALALHSAAACYAIARYAESRDRSWGAVAALQFGLAAATKHLGVVVAAIALALYLLSAVRSRGGIASRLKPAIVIALIAAAVPLPWYLRAWFASGNPVFPELFGLFGAYPSWRWDATTEQGLARFKAHFGMGRSPGALLALPWNVTVHGALYSGSIGPLFLVLLPGLLRSSRRPGAIRWLAYGVAAYVAVWASPLSSFQMRFLMPVVAPLAVLASAAFESIDRSAS